jgi:hypothetical protein
MALASFDNFPILEFCQFTSFGRRIHVMVGHCLHDVDLGEELCQLAIDNSNNPLGELVISTQSEGPKKSVRI